MTKIAIIGAGLAGLTLARNLPAHAEITVFEKARGIGGRMATRYAGDYEFDHGAQYFTAETNDFMSLLDTHKTRGNVRLWPVAVASLNGARETSAEKYVATPRMNALCKAMADGLDVRVGVQLIQITQQDGAWHLLDSEQNTHGPFDWVLSTVPAPQASALLPAIFSGHQEIIPVQMAGCFSLMLGFETPIDLPWPAARVAGSPIGWIAMNSDKPGRKTACSVLIQSSNEWAEAHMDDDRAHVQQTLLHAAAALAGTDLGNATHSALHRWRYAATPRPLGTDFLLDEANQLAACGDWCLGSRVEAAFTSAQKLAIRLCDLV